MQMFIKLREIYTTSIKVDNSKSVKDWNIIFSSKPKKVFDEGHYLGLQLDPTFLMIEDAKRVNKLFGESSDSNLSNFISSMSVLYPHALVYEEVIGYWGIYTSENNKIVSLDIDFYKNLDLSINVQYLKDRDYSNFLAIH